MIRTLLSILIFAGMLSASDKCVGFVDGKQADVDCPVDEKPALRAEIASLKAQLAVLQLQFQYQMKVCSAPDLMKAQIAAQESAEALEKAKKAATKPKDEPTP